MLWTCRQCADVEHLAKVCFALELHEEGLVDEVEERGQPVTLDDPDASDLDEDAEQKSDIEMLNQEKESNN